MFSLEWKSQDLNLSQSDSKTHGPQNNDYIKE